jgi:hypothetical protein
MMLPPALPFPPPPSLPLSAADDDDACPELSEFFASELLLSLLPHAVRVQQRTAILKIKVKVFFIFSVPFSFPIAVNFSAIHHYFFPITFILSMVFSSICIFNKFYVLIRLVLLLKDFQQVNNRLMPVFMGFTDIL